MKIDKIHIYGFGQWQDKTFDFKDDLQVFLGPNEAGKSTLYQFILQLLFGFANRKQKDEYYRPLHSLAYGGKIWLRTEELGSFTVERVEKQGQMLCQVHLSNGEQGGEELLQYCLSGMNGSWYDHFYGINLKALQAQQQLPLADLNQFYLNEGILGSQQLMQAEKERHEQADQLYRKQARIRPINAQLSYMEDLEKELKQAKKQNKSYMSLLKDEASKKDQLNQWENQLKQKKKQMKKIEQMREDWPKFEKIEKLDEQVKSMTEHPLPQNGLVKYEEISEKIQQLKNERTDFLKELKQEEQTGRVGPVLTHAEIERLQKRLQKLHVQAEKMSWLEKEEKESIEDLLKWSSQAELEPEKLATIAHRYEEDPQAVEKLWKNIQEENHELVLLEKSLKQEANQKNTDSRASSMKVQLFLILLSFILSMAFFRQSNLLLTFLMVSLLLLQILTVLFVHPAVLRRLLKEKQIENRQVELEQSIRKSKGKLEDLRMAWFDLLGEGSMSMIDQDYPLEGVKSSLTAQEKLNQIRQQIFQLEEKMSLELEELGQLFGIAVQGDRLKVLTDIERQVKALRSVKGDFPLPYIKQVDKRIDQLLLQQKEWLELCQARNESEMRNFYKENDRRQGILKEMKELQASMEVKQSDFQTFENIDQLHQTFTRLEQDIQHLSQNYQQLKEEYLDLQVSIHDLESRGTYDKLRQHFEYEKSKLKNLIRQWLSYRYEAQLIHQTVSLAQEGYLPQLVQIASALFEQLTAGEYSSVFLRDGLLQVRDRQDQSFKSYQLSSATQDQLYLAWRLAFIQSLGDLRKMPIIIDDGFVNFDDHRLHQLMALLKELASKQQIIILSKDVRLSHEIASDHIQYL